MKFNSAYTIVFLAFYVLNLVIRFIYTNKLRNSNNVVASKKDSVELGLLAISRLGMRVIPLIYVFTPLLDRFNFTSRNYFLPAGILLSCCSTFLLYLSHHSLRKNWSLSLQVRSTQQLVTGGIYKYIRHPMYLSILLWSLSLIFLLHNYIAAFVPLALFLLLIFSRMPREEKMMVQSFGQPYQDYAKRTYRLIPFVY